jgi:peptidoglycan/LPS O-acetylase OafA/YrhL
VSRFDTLNDLSKLPALSYRPEVDGLRAIAILLVVFYHADLGFSGGFIGVDVFFVISGYLITSIILKTMTTNTFTFAEFIERRVRRIMPAGVAMIAVVMVAGWFLLLPSDFLDLSKAAMSQVVFAANIYFYKTTNYFSGASEEKPLLHTWSLAVEEQFYLLFPVFLIIAWKQRWFRSQVALIWVMVAGVVASFILNLANIGPNPIATFYLLPMRAWELLLGAVVAVVPAPAAHHCGNQRSILGFLQWTGVVMIIAAGTLYTSDTTFPGLNALLPCVGAALFIWASGGESGRTSILTPRGLLSCSGIVFIGLISYSLYLWHWPLFAFTRYFSLSELSLPVRVGLVLVSGVFAVISWHFVEKPFRRKKAGTERIRVFAAAFACSAILLSAAGYVLATSGLPGRLPDALQGLDKIREARSQHGTLTSAAFGDVLAGNLPSIGTVRAGGPIILVWGDSHAQNVLPALEDFAKRDLGVVVAAWHPRTLPALDYSVEVPYSLGLDAPAWAAAVLDYVRTRNVTDVLLAARWSAHWRNARDFGDGPKSVEAALLRTIEQLESLGARVWLLTEIPEHKADPVKAMMVRRLFGIDIAPYLADKASLAETTGESEGLLMRATAHGARLIDARRNLYDSQLSKFRMDKDGELLYSDSHHLTETGALETSESFLPLFGR